MKRYVKEYVNDITKGYNKECEAYKDIQKIIRFLERGLITNVEAIETITDRVKEARTNNENVFNI